MSMTEKESKLISRTKVPKRYSVVILNDDYSSMDFVIKVLTGIFRKTLPEAEKLTIDIHNKGSAVAGTYSKEIASTKLNMMKSLAKKEGMPLTGELKEA